MTITYHKDLIQGSDEWYAIRCGLLTASEMKNIITPAKLQYSSNEKERTHLYEIAAQRVTKYVEPTYVSDDMLKGKENEIYAREVYSKNYAPVESVGFITNDRWGFTIGYSPDGLIGDDGSMESKSRRQKYQFETIATDVIPVEYSIQLQTGLLVSERKWLDFVSYHGGMPMLVKRVYPDPIVQTAILQAATIFHEKLDAVIAEFHKRVDIGSFKMTERIIEEEITI